MVFGFGKEKRGKAPVLEVSLEDQAHKELQREQMRQNFDRVLEDVLKHDKTRQLLEMHLGREPSDADFEALAQGYRDNMDEMIEFGMADLGSMDALKDPVSTTENPKDADESLRSALDRHKNTIMPRVFPEG